MSAECNDCGNDLVYGMGDMNDMYCPVCSVKDRLDTALRALWECLLLSGADVSSYAYETNTKAGRERGLAEWMLAGTPAEVVAAVEAMDDDGLTIEEDAAVLIVVEDALRRPKVTWHPLTEARLRSAREKLR